MHSDELLHVDLVSYVRADCAIEMVSHRYFVGIALPYGMSNAQYLATKAEAQRLKAARDWRNYISVHPRPYRIEALLDAIEGGLDKPPEAFWDAVGGVWTDSENIYQSVEEWADIWHSEVPDRHLVMSECDRKALEALPERVRVWRGTNCEEGVWGLSWTVSKAKALWFARRFSKGKGYLVDGHVDKSDILSYFGGRGEKEIVAMPIDVVVDNVVVV